MKWIPKPKFAHLQDSNSISSYPDKRVQSQHSLISTLFGFLRLFVLNVTPAIAKLLKSEFAHF